MQKENQKCNHNHADKRNSVSLKKLPSNNNNSQLENEKTEEESVEIQELMLNGLDKLIYFNNKVLICKASTSILFFKRTIENDNT